MRTRFDVDDMTIHRVVESEYGFVPALQFLPGLSSEQLEESRSSMPGALDSEDRLVLCFQSYIVKTPHHTVLVDTCVGNDKVRPVRETWNRKTGKDYMSALVAAGVTVDDIDFVMCTHLHADHVGWNTRLQNGQWVPTFPNARYVFSQKEYEFWAEEHARNRIKDGDANAAIADSVLPIVAARKADLVSSEHALNDHVRLMPTPGHSPDHFAVCFGCGGDAAVVTGDLIHSPIQARYPDMGRPGDFDQKQGAITRRSFLERYCDTSTLCCMSHFPSPSVGRIRRWGEGFRCTPLRD
jgi:glyoxylase-like metal-dependent hydrolase (beta-lactamase superfamily II)